MRFATNPIPAMPERSNGKAAGMGIEEKPRLSSETVDEASRGRAKFPPFFAIASATNLRSPVRPRLGAFELCTEL